jgi:hypothetical protein
LSLPQLQLPLPLLSPPQLLSPLPPLPLLPLPLPPLSLPQLLLPLPPLPITTAAVTHKKNCVAFFLDLPRGGQLWQFPIDSCFFLKILLKESVEI